jgi:hypothetical protein
MRLTRVFRCFLWGTVLLALGSTASSAQKDTHVLREPLSVLLTDLGEKYDRYFTLEDVMPQEGPLRSYHLERDCPYGGRCDTTLPGLHSVEQELDEISRGNSDFRYEVDSREPKLIHIVNDRLKTRADYPLNEHLHSVQFAGTLWDLVKYLRGRGVPLNYMVGVIGPDSLMDVSTKVSIKVQNATVREVLSDFVTLDASRSRILWESQTDFQPGSTVDVWYPGSLKQIPRNGP